MRVVSKWSYLWFYRVRAKHLPFIGHKFSPACIRIRPSMYCDKCCSFTVSAEIFDRLLKELDD